MYEMSYYDDRIVGCASIVCVRELRMDHIIRETLEDNANLRAIFVSRATESEAKKIV